LGPGQKSLEICHKLIASLNHCDWEYEMEFFLSPLVNFKIKIVITSLLMQL